MGHEDSVSSTTFIPSAQARPVTMGEEEASNDEASGALGSQGLNLWSFLRLWQFLLWILLSPAGGWTCAPSLWEQIPT